MATFVGFDSQPVDLEAWYESADFMALLGDTKSPGDSYEEASVEVVDQLALKIINTEKPMPIDPSIKLEMEIIASAYRKIDAMKPSSTKPFPCPHAGCPSKGYGREADLTKHRMDKHNEFVERKRKKISEDLKTRVCQICQKRFVNKKDLTRHTMRVHV